MKEPDPRDYERWVELSAAGDQAASSALVEALWQPLLAHVGAQRVIRASAAAEDHAHDVAVAVIGRILSGNLAAKYLEWRREQGTSERFLHWIFTVAERTAADHMREQLGRSKRALGASLSPGAKGERFPSQKRFLNEFTLSLSETSEGSTRPPFTNVQAIKELVGFATKRLPLEQLRVLELWLEGSTASEIEVALKLEAGAAESLRRAAIATLRRHFLR
jgi:DNA-directed RNA polymerase specialized sigma24 family protein